MFRVFLLAAGLLITISSFGQDSLKTKKDTITLLNEVVVHAYANDRPLLEVPAAIGFVDTKTLERFSNTSLLPAVNALPGVRMEERSPGSYRFVIRGSSLRSPFGVRNVKMYWNGLPLTDGGGNTYLNLVDFNAVGRAEIIKGPGGSLYGAGTGGVVLLSSPSAQQDQIQLSSLGGSYGLQRYQVNAQAGSEKIKVSVNFAHQQAHGYREHAAMRRDALNTDWRFAISKKSTLSASLFYTDLYYQTPGALNKAQYDTIPKEARPGGAVPGPGGAVAQKAAVYNKTIFAGVMYDYQWNDKWSTRAGLYVSAIDYINPTLRNYEKRKENNWGGRTETQYQVERTKWKGKLTFGGEFQQFYSPLTDYQNLGGTAGSIQTDDRLYSTQLLLFAQAEVDLPGNFYLTAGGSGNFLDYGFNRISVTPNVPQKRNFDPVFSPRIALSKKIKEKISVYASISNGFSPPSLAEVRPSTGTYNNSLNPERGTNFEGGVRGTLGRQFSFDITAYHFELDQTIVVLYQQSGSDYFHNAGSTTQNGMETMLSWTPVLSGNGFLSDLKFWGSYTLNRYRFNNYVQDSVVFSHNNLTGVSPNIVVAGVDVMLMKKLYANVTFNYVDKIPLNNANSEYASAYQLLGMRIGYTSQFGKNFRWELFGGVDNAFDASYSLGNDLNAAGGRYYNASAGRNYYLGLKVNAGKKK